MNTFSTSTKVLFFVFLAQSLFAQVDKDFEFLDHRSQRSAHYESIIVDDHFVYVGYVGNWPMLNVVNVNTLTNEIDTILITVEGRTDLSEFSDGTFDIYIHSLFDYDFPLDGFLHVSYDGNSFQVDTLSEVFSGIFVNGIYAFSAIKNGIDEYYMVGNDSLYVGDKQGFTGLAPVEYHSRLFQNDARDEFLFAANHISKINNDYSIDTIQVFSSRILEIKNRGEYNDVLMEGMLQTWSDDFSQLFRTWQFEEEINSFYNVHVGDSLLTILDTSADGYNYFTLSEQGDQNTIASSGATDLKHFHRLDDHSMLGIYNYLVPDLDANQLLLRYYDVDTPSDYDKRQVSLDSASVVYISRDTFDVIVDNGDTIYFTYDNYDINLSYTNNSAIPIQELNILSSNLYSQIDLNEKGLNFPQKSLLQPGESSLITEEWTYRYNPVITFGIPGVDYRINDDPNWFYYADVTLDVENIISEVDFKIYPNPTADELNIDIDEIVEEYAIYNQQGQLIKLQFNTENISKIDVSFLPQGPYFLKLRIKDKNEVAIQQFVKF